MKYGECRIEDDHAYVLPISDCHVGDAAFEGDGYKLLKENIDWVRSEPNARVFLNGDILNVATRFSASSPFEQTMNLQQQVEFAIKMFMPIKDKIVGCIDGNHELRLQDFVGYSPLTPICHELNIPYYKHSAVMVFIVGKGNGIAYSMYMHHTCGGGSTPGGKMNRVDKLRQLVSNCDAYIGSHNHQLGVIPVTTRTVDIIHKKIVVQRQVLIDSGSYLSWNDSYAEAKMLPPAKLGSPRVRLNGKRKDIHVSV